MAEMIKRKEKFLNRFFNGTFMTFISLFIWEMFEEVIEESIAFGITELIEKTLSIFLLISITQTLKIAIKRFIKTITYKEGKDKMKLLKNFLILMWGNKITGIMTGSLAGSFVYFQAILPQYASNYLYAVIVFVFIYILSALLGGEYLYQIIDRLAQKNLKKEQYQKAKEIEANARKYALMVENAKKTVDEYEKARALLQEVEQKKSIETET